MTDRRQHYRLSDLRPVEPKPRWVDDWRTEADEDVTLPKLVAALLIYVLLLAAFVADVLLVWAAQQ